MSTKTLQKKDATIGYFTVVEDESTGWTGGILVLDSGGRPVEFQCTLPVRSTRTHEILFGPTLRSHLICEVIGKLLVEKCRTPLALLCCDQPESLLIESYTEAPVSLVSQAAESEEGPLGDDMISGAAQISVAGAPMYVAIERVGDVEAIASLFNDLPDAVEPFERIREAINEAHSQLARQRMDAA